jgi:hypothetical protein
MKKLYVGALAALFLVSGLAACKNDSDPDPVDPEYQGVYIPNNGIYEFQYLKLNADSVEYGPDANDLKSLGGISTGGGVADDGKRWDYVYADGEKIGIVVQTPASTSILFGQETVASLISTGYISGADASGIADDGLAFSGYKKEE